MHTFFRFEEDRLLFLGSPDVNTEFHTLNFAADFGMLNLWILYLSTIL